MADLAEYKLKHYYWPPPDDRKHVDVYLFGFDEDNQPYIVRWEKRDGAKGWVATTLSDYKSDGSTAVAVTYVGDAVGKLLEYWADAPALMRTVFKVRAEKAAKQKKED